ncbi:hypothetical protein FSB73_19180 [Arachidicoccus ginsenosidivorans]|uniref:Uncharacterized protein n=1 Tax=Arachidicoccus ginsenosidivorans TaxID=496057 RepID=A0A5B8VRD7_9BACT|nr:hypothetical protein [Arachidicoccus ginsenosidivorans]QEC73462.1 hypothetical protein FSB73_19180 [Arachidicoccus ginsenosidivorans]
MQLILPGCFAGKLLKLVALSFVIAAPVAWYAMHKWLNHFDDRMAAHLWWFILADAIGILVVIIWGGWQAVKAAG